MSTVFRSLMPAKELVEAMGFSISYPHDDLIFIDNNAFLLRYNDFKEKAFFLYFNQELESIKKKELRSYVLQAACDCKVEVEIKGTFKVRPSLEKQGELELVYND